MNRRAVIKFLIAIPLASAPIPTKAADSWIFLGKRIVGPNTRSVSFAIDSETKGVRKLGIELRGNSVWLYDLKIAAADGNRVNQPVNLNIPPSSDGCIPRIRIWRTGEQPKNCPAQPQMLAIDRKAYGNFALGLGLASPLHRGLNDLEIHRW